MRTASQFLTSRSIASKVTRKVPDGKRVRQIFLFQKSDIPDWDIVPYSKSFKQPISPNVLRSSRYRDFCLLQLYFCSCHHLFARFLFSPIFASRKPTIAHTRCFCSVSLDAWLLKVMLPAKRFQISNNKLSRRFR